jgi:Tol biopolymer transport system component
MGILNRSVLGSGIVVVAVVAGRWAGTAPAPQPPAPGTAVPTSFGPIHPRLSRAGDKVVFSYQGALWWMPRQGGTAVRLTDGPGFDIEPAWSPDGARIAYINSPGFSQGELRLVRVDDGAPVKLPNTVVAEGTLEYGPEGTRLLGRFQVPRGSRSLAWLDLNSGALEPMATGTRQPDRYALSHDGRRLAFTTTSDVPGQQSGNDGPEADVWTVSSQGGEPAHLVRFPARIHELCWVAGDRALVVATELGGVHNDLWEVPLDDPERGALRLTSGQADEDRPSTSDDGGTLLYTDNREGPTSLVLRDLATGRDETRTPTFLDYRCPTGRLELNVQDASDGSPLVARVSLRHDSGKFHAPPGSLYRFLRGNLHFYAFQRIGLDLPAGHYEVMAAHGPEYRITREAFDVEPGRTTTQALALQRWTRPSDRGWYPGENHIHANYGYGHWYNSPRTMSFQCAGEDLRVANLMVANSDGDGVFDREYFRGRPDPLSDDHTLLYWNEEFRSTVWGHATLVNLKYLVEPIYTGFRGTTRPWDTPTNADVADLTHDEGGVFNYTHPAQSPTDPYVGPYTAKALPMDAALGKVDSMDVMGANHAAALPLWYRLLNCGFRIAASAGTDCFLNRIPSRLPGADRVYVRIAGGFTYERWIEGLKAGRTFVTNGPMLELDAEGAGPGETARVLPGGRLRIHGRATSQYPLDRLELVHDGRVVAGTTAGGDRLSVEIETSVPVERCGWVALRVSGPPHPDQPDNSVFAHTGVVWIDVPGRPADASEDATHFLAWIDRLAADVRARDRIPPRLRSHVESQIAQARAVFEAMRREP